MDGNKLPSPCLELAAFRRYYSDLLDYVHRPADLAQFLFADSLINREVKDSITSAGTDVERRRAVLDAFQHALLRSPEPSTTMRTLRRAFGQANFYTRVIDYMEDFVDGEHTIYP